MKFYIDQSTVDMSIAQAERLLKSVKSQNGRRDVPYIKFAIPESPKLTSYVGGSLPNKASFSTVEIRTDWLSDVARSLEFQIRNAKNNGGKK